MFIPGVDDKVVGLCVEGGNVVGLCVVGGKVVGLCDVGGCVVVVLGGSVVVGSSIAVVVVGA